MNQLSVESFDSVWDAVADTPDEAENLRVRSELIEARGWTQAEAASNCGVAKHRISELMHGRISRFSLDSLVNITTALGAAGACET